MDLYYKLFGDGDAMRQEVKFSKTYPDAKTPNRAYDYDAGNDLFALEDAYIKPGETIKIKTGISVALPEGTQGIIKDRSSLGSKGIHVMAGVIDSSYRGEISVVLHNTNGMLAFSESYGAAFKHVMDGRGWFGFMRHQDLFDFIEHLWHRMCCDFAYKIKKGDKIAQLIVSPITVVDWKEVEILDTTKRGSGGFGSTDK